MLKDLFNGTYSVHYDLHSVKTTLNAENMNVVLFHVCRTSLTSISLVQIAKGKNISGRLRHEYYHTIKCVQILVHILSKVTYSDTDMYTLSIIVQTLLYQKLEISCDWYPMPCGGAKLISHAAKMIGLPVMGNLSVQKVTKIVPILAWSKKINRVSVTPTSQIPPPNPPPNPLSCSHYTSKQGAVLWEIQVQASVDHSTVGKERGVVNMQASRL